MMGRIKLTNRRPMEGAAPAPLKLSYGIREAGQALGVSRPTLYRMISRGELTTFKLGSRTLIRRTELDALLDRLSQPPT